MKGSLGYIFGVEIFEDVYAPDKIAHQEKGSNRIFVSSKVYKALKEAKNDKQIRKALDGVKVIELEPFKINLKLEL
jgi:hypothetical protein